MASGWNLHTGRLLLVLALVAGCLPSSASPAAAPTPPEASVGEEVPTLLAVGDIGHCGGGADEAVAALAAARAGDVALLGDLAYENGRAAEFEKCFNPAWGPLLHRLRPVPGNHEYQTDGASGYFDYFGEAAATPGQGWYAYAVGGWLVLALNSNCDQVGGCGPGSAQYAFVADQLETQALQRPRFGFHHCTLAYWHHARFSSGSHADDPRMDPIWELLTEFEAEVVLSGHDHTYERVAPVDGLRQFVVGTGGRSLYPFESPPGPMTEVRAADTYGLLELTLEGQGYAWQFVPAAGVGGSFTDAGAADCH